MKNAGYYFAQAYLYITLLGGAAGMMIGFTFEGLNILQEDYAELIAVIGVLLLTASMGMVMFPDKWAFKE